MTSSNGLPAEVDRLRVENELLRTENEQLRVALASRIVIEHAKGFLLE
jgi:regulator of replication initiation timing